MLDVFKENKDGRPKDENERKVYAHAHKKELNIYTTAYNKKLKAKAKKCKEDG